MRGFLFGLGSFFITHIIVVSTVQCAQAQTSGNKLYEDCSVEDQMHFGLCYGYIEGVFDTDELTTPLCGYNGVSNRQLRDIVFQYLYTHPAEMHERANWLVTRALKSAFPCQK